MNLLPPKIDPRTYAQLVANTEWLAQCFTGYGFLELMDLDKAGPLPTAGKGSVIVGKRGNSYHVRIFDWAGTQIFDTGQNGFQPSEALRQQLKDAFDKFDNKQPIDNTTKSKLLQQIQKSLRLMLEFQWLPPSGDKAETGYEVLILKSLDFPKEGKGLVVVGKDQDSYYIRIFDWVGRQIPDKKINTFELEEVFRQQLKDAFDNQQSIDDTTKSKLLQQIQKSLGLTLIGDRADVGRALIRIFGRMAMMVTDRLNRVPEKHFLAFLNLIGAKQQPPRPARVPLTAYLVNDSPVDAIIPAHTQIAALPQAGETEEVLFETEQDLVVVRSQLQAAIVHTKNEYYDHILTATTATGNFPVFTMESPNTIYIAADQLTTAVDSREIQLAIANSEKLAEWGWSYWDGATWQALNPEPAKNPANNSVNNRLKLTVSEVVLRNWKPPQSKIIEGVAAQWLRAIAPTVPEALPELAAIHFVRDAIPETAPDQAFFNTEAIDLSKDFLPLGETPHFNDTFYVANQNLLNLGGSEVTLHFEPSSGIEPKPSSNPAPSIVWETWNGDVWTPVLKTGETGEAFYTSDWNRGTKTFKLPSRVAPLEVNGEKNYWLRARLVAGNYGGESQLEPMEYTLYTYTTTLPEKDRGTVNILKKDNSYQVCIFDWNGNKTENIAPDPALVGKLSTAFPSDNQPINAATRSELIKQIQTILNHRSEPIFRFASNSKSGYFPPCLKSVKLSRSDSNVNPSKTLKSFPTGAFLYSDTNTFSVPGFYVCFDLPFPNQTIALYLQVAPLKPGDLPKPTPEASTPDPTPAKLQWEYRNAEGWQPLTVQDGTQNLGQRGMVQFIGPADFASQTLFGRSGYWLRLRLLEGTFQIPPRLQRVLTNTVWAIQAATYQDEILGSGTGDPNLVLFALHTPLLPGQQLLVRESELPPPEEQVEIKKLEGENAIAISTDASGQQDIWVRWHEVSDFYASGSRDRHYALDRMTGEIRFGGDGQGMAPPVGRNNIRLAWYQSGGGSQGNCAAETLTDLKTTVPYIDRVTNHETAGGGADLEVIAAVQESGPKQLRHGDRAVTWQDIADLTYAASSEIARVKVLTPAQFIPTDPQKTWIPNTQTKTATRTDLPGLEDALGKAGTVTVIIVPHSHLQRPTPSLALIEQVNRYLGDRLSPTLRLQVTEPSWVEVSITATIVPVSLEAANGLATNVNAALTAFLHPLTGGTQKRGWIFGRHPHESDIYALIERQPGVSHVTNLVISPQEDAIVSIIKEQFLIYSGNHQITITPL